MKLEVNGTQGIHTTKGVTAHLEDGDALTVVYTDDSGVEQILRIMFNGNVPGPMLLMDQDSFVFIRANQLPKVG